MGLIALLAALVVGAIAATALPVLAFAMVLTAVFVVGSIAAIVLSASASGALWSALALFACAQVGYALGLAALAGIGTGLGTARPSGAASRSHFWVRK